MVQRHGLLLALVVSLLGACSDRALEPPKKERVCAGGYYSTLPGVRIELCLPQAAFTLAEAAEGIPVEYTVVVNRDIAGVIPLPQDEGGCGQPHESGLIVFEDLFGNGQRYCRCDQGLCAPREERPVTLRSGSYQTTLVWNGRNWRGPSDTNQPEGLSFPPGSYRLTVSAVGQVDEGGARRGFLVQGVISLGLIE